MDGASCSSLIRSGAWLLVVPLTFVRSCPVRRWVGVWSELAAVAVVKLRVFGATASQFRFEPGFATPAVDPLSREIRAECPRIARLFGNRSDICQPGRFGRQERFRSESAQRLGTDGGADHLACARVTPRPNLAPDEFCHLRQDRDIHLFDSHERIIAQSVRGEDPIVTY
jgi:hypothetical protein